MKQSRVIHPFLFAIVPVLFLFSHNIGELSILELEMFVRIVLLMAVTVLLTSVLWAILNINYGNKHKAGILASIFLFMFFSYGHFGNVSDNVMIRVGDFDHYFFQIGNLKVESSIFYFSLCASLCLLMMYFLRKINRDLTIFTRFFNVVSTTLVIMSLTNISLQEIKRGTTSFDRRVNQLEVHSTDAKEAPITPDIYYIILDAYASTNTLKKYFHYDNQEFLDYLTERGFYIASKSRSNYGFTYLSLASSLNMKYLNHLSDELGKESRDMTVVKNIVENNMIMRFLKSKGYKFIFFRSGFAPTEYNRYADWDDDKCSRKFISNRFTNLFIKMTMLEPFFRFYASTSRREKILCQFATLAQIHNIEEPIFAFAHFVCPHGPSIFGANGEPVSENSTLSGKDGYLNQLIFVNKKLKVLIDEILSKSGHPPIIILQADHGPSIDPKEFKDFIEQLKAQMRIFNAYYLPQRGDTLLYESITPVNTFRLIFNYYFGTNYALLDDRSYYSDHLFSPYKFTDVTDQVRYE